MLEQSTTISTQKPQSPNTIGCPNPCSKSLRKAPLCQDDSALGLRRGFHQRTGLGQRFAAQEIGFCKGSIVDYGVQVFKWMLELYVWRVMPSVSKLDKDYASMSVGVIMEWLC